MAKGIKSTSRNKRKLGFGQLISPLRINTVCYVLHEATADPMYSQKLQDPVVEEIMKNKKRRNIRDGLGVADESKSVNIIQY